MGKVLGADFKGGEVAIKAILEGIVLLGRSWRNLSVGIDNLGSLEGEWCRTELECFDSMCDSMDDGWAKIEISHHRRAAFDNNSPTTIRYKQWRNFIVNKKWKSPPCLFLPHYCELLIVVVGLGFTVLRFTIFNFNFN